MTGYEDQKLDLSIWTDIYIYIYISIFIYMCFVMCLLYIFMQKVLSGNPRYN